MNRSVVYFLILVFLGANSYSQEFVSGHPEYTLEDIYAYNFVKSTCDVSLESLTHFVENTRDDVGEYFLAFIPGTPVDKKDNLIDRGGIGRRAHMILNSPGYYQGLRECYPNDRDKQDTYTSNLLVFDGAGKFSAIAIVVGAGGLIYYVAIGAAEYMVVAPLASELQTATAARTIQLIDKIRQWRMRIRLTGLATAAVPVIMSIHNVASQVQARHAQLEKDAQDDQQKKDVLKTLESSLTENSQFYSLIQIMSRHAERPEDKTALAEASKHQKENMQSYIRLILKNQDLTPAERQYYVSLALSLN